MERSFCGIVYFFQNMIGLRLLGDIGARDFNDVGVGVRCGVGAEECLV